MLISKLCSRIFVYNATVLIVEGEEGSSLKKYISPINKTDYSSFNQHISGLVRVVVGKGTNNQYALCHLEDHTKPLDPMG